MFYLLKELLKASCHCVVSNMRGDLVVFVSSSLEEV